MWNFLSCLIKALDDSPIMSCVSLLLLAGPHFVAVNNKNEIVVTDFHNHSVKVWSVSSVRGSVCSCVFRKESYLEGHTRLVIFRMLLLEFNLFSSVNSYSHIDSEIPSVDWKRGKRSCFHRQ